jgi:tRNA dimethylallyltransferase
MTRPTLIVIAGPTAIGKTAVAIALAKALKTEILSADSRQFFREMSIGTAKPSAGELAEAPHHFINTLSIQEDYNAGKYEEEAIPLLDHLFQTHPFVILAGGSGMYVDAVCKGFDPLPAVTPEQREELNALFAKEGLPALQELLFKHDPDHYANVDLKNPQRLIRALEVTLSTGTPYSSLRKGKVKHRNFNILRIGLHTQKESLHARINKRVDAMMQEGFVEEAKTLYPLRHLNALQSVGYSELFDYLEEKLDLPSAIDLIKQNTRRFAKRQMTWFQKDRDTVWLDPLTQPSLLSDIHTLARNKTEMKPE